MSNGESATTDAGYHKFLASILSDRESFFRDVVGDIALPNKLRCAMLTLLALSAFYGFVAGWYAGPLQAVSAAVKLPFLFVTTFAICFPALFVVQILVGSKLRLLQVVVLIAASLALTTVLLAAFVPIVAFFLITGANYYFLELLHVVIILVCGALGMYALHEGLSYVCERHGVYPRKALTILRVWVFLFAFVGVQLAWNLRPFLGDRNAPFKVFRHYEGNFYTAVVYSVNKLLKGEGASKSHDALIDDFSGADIDTLMWNRVLGR